MQQDFDLEVILTITTGINLTDDFNKVFELAWFVFDDPFINVSGIYCLEDELKTHLFSIHPNLLDITYPPKSRFLQNFWLQEQKELLGDTLPVCKKDEKLNYQKRVKQHILKK